MANEITNYQETDIVGKSWLRSHHMVVQNPFYDPLKLTALPTLTFARQRMYPTEDGSVMAVFKGEMPPIVFDMNNPDHVAFYTLANKLFMEQCALVDAPPVVVEPPV
jgi:hypothetical protein